MTSGDRAAAEYAQSISGHPYTHIVIRQNGEERRISNAELESKPLPEGPFELTGVHLQHNREVTDGGLAHLKDCKKIKRLDISGNPAIGNKELGYFRECTDLTNLNIAYADVDDNGLAFLAD